MQALGPEAIRAQLATGWPTAGTVKPDVLRAVWSGRAALHTDEAVRDGLVQLGPQQVQGPALQSGLALSRAQAAWRAGDGKEAVREALAAIARGDALTQARARLLVGFVRWQSGDTEGATRAWRRARQLAMEHGGVTPDPAWLDVGAVERLWSATMASSSGDVTGAIEGLLEVPRASSRWAMARRGLALAQLDGQRVERTLKILGLLPGGWLGTPSRSLIAAVALSAIGQHDTSQELARAAQAKARAWTQGSASMSEVVAWWSATPSHDDGSFLAEVARQPSIGRLAKELAVARVQSGGGYVSALEERLKTEVTDAIMTTRQAAQRAHSDLAAFTVAAPEPKP